MKKEIALNISEVHSRAHCKAQKNARQFLMEKNKAFPEKKKIPYPQWEMKKPPISFTVDFQFRSIQKRVYDANLSAGSRDDQDTLFKRLTVIWV